MEYPEYHGYKDSEVKWIGLIPIHWNSIKLKFTTYIKGRVGWHGLNSSEFLTEGEYYLVTGTDFQQRRINWNNCYRISEERYEEDPYIHLTEGDLLVTKDGTIGKTAQVIGIPHKASVNSGVFVTRPLHNSNYEPNFLYYVLSSEVFNGFIDNQKSGTTINHLYQEVFENFQYSFPQSIEEQQQIARFLDYKTSQIDSLIEKKKALIEKLHEKRIAIITQAVTKGLDPNVPMRDSGIEWLGKIPEHWEVKRLRFAIKTNPVKSEVKDISPDVQVSFVPMDAVGEYGGIRLDTDKSMDDVINGYTYFKNNDVVVAKITPCFENGKGALAQGLTNGIAFGTTELHVMRPLNGISSRWLFYLSISYAFRAIGTPEMYGAGGQKRVPEEFIKDFRLGIPNFEEQESIADFIDKENMKIDEMIRVNKETLSRLAEYRTALITAAVTGKIDVRNIEIPEDV